jgi:hypothetical protein
MSPTLVTQQQVKAWADIELAKSVLPSLVRRLILNSADTTVSDIHFPAFEEGVLGGYDGELTAASKHYYIPDGVSVFELSIRSDVTTKANDDYEKRKTNPGSKIPTNTTYVALTPRRWATKADWLKTKKAEKFWKDVRAYDITDLFTWIEQDPLTHLWLTEQISGQLIKATSASAYWKSWKIKTKPELDSKLILAGRRDEVARLFEHLKSSTTSIPIKTSTVYEGVLFAIASIVEQNDPSIPVESVVVVNDDSGMSQLIASKKPLIIICSFPSFRLEEAIENGHKVISVLQPSHAGDATTLVVPTLNSEEVRALLVDGGMDLNEAYKLGNLASRSFFAYLRSVAINPVSLKPTWLGPENISVLTAASLLGSWNDKSEADRKVVEKISGKTYEEYEAILTGFELLGDTPAIHRGDVWSVVDKEDLISLVRSGYTKTQLGHYFDATIEMLGTKDPKYDLPISDWYMARVLDKRPIYSENLSNNTPTTLAILASKYGTEKPNGLTYSIQDNVSNVARSVLATANDDKSGKLWLTLNSILSPIAEAAPEVFIELLEKDLQTDNPVVKALFVTDSSFFSSSPYTSLVYALEHLSWNEQYHSRVILILGKLNRFYEKNNVSPSPMSALNEIFSIIHKRPTLSDDEKLESLELLIREYPEVAKSLMFALIPEYHNSSMGLSEPLFRRWSNVKGQRMPLTYPELYKMEDEIIQRLLPLIKNDEDRIELIGKITDLPVETFNRVLQFFDESEKTLTDFDTRQKIWSKMIEVIAHHREFPDAKWSYPKESLDELEKITEKFVPPNDISRDAYLFDHRPRVPNPTGRGWEEDSKLVETMQRESAKEIYNEQGSKGIEDLAKISPVPGYIGKALSDNEVGDNINDDIVGFFNRQDRGVIDIAHSYVYNRSLKLGTKKVLDYISAHKKDWPDEKLVAAFIALQIDKPLLDYLEKESEQVQKLYWTNRSPYGLGTIENVDYIANQFLKHDLVFRAIDFIGIYSGREENDLHKDTILSALNKGADASFDPKQIDTQMFSYNTGEMFKMLDVFGVDNETLVKLEMMWYSVIKRDRPTLAIHKKIAQDPDFFIELLELAYKEHSAKRKKLTKPQENQAYAAHELLESWNIIPGKQDDGDIDFPAFKSWVEIVRTKALVDDRAEIADQLIGGIIVKGISRDADWPPDPISELLDDIKSEQIETGILVTTYNTGGMIDLSESQKPYN